jgi:electron transfer flavoprotein beta subunit
MVTALAKGADHAVTVSAGLDSAPDNHTAARVFASLLRDKRFDLILTGVRAIDDLDGSLGGLLAGFLDLPYVGLIRKVKVEAGGNTTVIEKEYPGGCAAELAVTPPAVLGIQAAERPPRYVPITRLRQMMKTASVEELLVPPATLPPMGVVRMFKPEEGAGAKMLTGSLEAISQQVTGLIAERHLLR